MQSRDVIPSEELEISENIMLSTNFTFPLVYLLSCIYIYIFVKLFKSLFLVMLSMPRI